ncbi:protease I [Salsuginibacillus halophilus]|uniref:Protease I n=1 Tax=Salsuginibacillus halophilus TaxID=517424 RepID=A0A2P8HBI8_9BACI|nr:type 1 glutamine amidotransferase domain-containing protein [Salsuginibacillus halophilus]PSL43579.1 protease I [Salsuginibacillus halophilus]
MGKKIAVLMTNWFEDSEYTSPKQELEGAGHELTVIEKEAGKTIKGKSDGTEVVVDAGIENVKPEDFDALLIPGGFSPDILRTNDKIVNFAKYFMDHDLPVFAICHGPQLLITAKAIEGRKATGFYSIMVDMEYAKADLKDEEVVVCHNLVTSRTPDDLEAFNRESLRQLQA